MTEHQRIRIAPDGTLRLPEEIVDRLRWKPGTYLEVTVEAEGSPVGRPDRPGAPGKGPSSTPDGGGPPEASVRLRKVDVDPFAEALKKPDEAAFDKILEKQRRSRDEALRSFEQKVRKGEVPKARPEDHPDFWR